MSINIGDNNIFENVRITEGKENINEDDVHDKSFSDKHPIIIGMFCSFVIGILLMFGFWQKIVLYIEGIFERL